MHRESLLEVRDRGLKKIGTLARREYVKGLIIVGERENTISHKRQKEF